MTPKTIALIIGFVAFCGVALTLTIYGIASHEEPGLEPAMMLLPDAARSGNLETPISICVSSYRGSETFDGLGLPSDEALRATSLAVETINDRVGFPLLSSGSIADVRCQIVVNMGAPPDHPGNENGGWATRCADGCCVGIAAPGSDEMTHLVLQHELGHCLGLAHDPFASSIMSPSLEPSPDGAMPPRITDADRDLLREIYAP